MSSEAQRQAIIDRWNMYKSRMESAGSAVIRATQFLVRPTEGFPRYWIAEIQRVWQIWRDEEECFWRMTKAEDTPPTRTFPKMPADDAEDCCFRMWGLLIQVQVDGTHGSTEYLRQTVEQIAANEKCQSHPATCSCHVPDHPWIYKEDVDALAPIRPLHNPKCRCGAGWNRCEQREMVNAARIASIKATQEANAYRVQAIAEAQAELAAHPDLKVVPCRCDAQYANVICSCLPGRVADAKKAAEAPAAAAPAAQKASSPYEYKHNVDSCACGTCHKARMDSGTADEYLARVQARSHAVFWGPQQAAKPAISIAAAAADTAIAKASAACGGSPTHPDFAKQLFAAMGTPHDSKCPHGLPFYACMPCSH